MKHSTDRHARDPIGVALILIAAALIGAGVGAMFADATQVEPLAWVSGGIVLCGLAIVAWKRWTE